ncbi:MAG TPA: glycoside hydrolase N-terminal domain-containing protein [Verrucomicrobiae bacterium]|nr:glycoside hydrolase N-terminal domain-containing protein [Verrucomicrobiae bacterium]
MTHAQVINFDAPGGLGAANYSGQGALSDSGNNYWNPVVKGGTTTGGLLSDGVTASSITLTDNSPNSYGQQSAQGTPGGLEAPFLDENNGSTVSNTLNNVPAGTYDLYLYGKNDNSSDADRGTSFTVSAGGTFYGTKSTANSVTTTFTEGNDYVVFSNLVVGTDGKIAFTYAANPAANSHHNPQTEGDFNGLQLVGIDIPPTISGQPDSVKISIGNSTQLVAIAGGVVPLFYQWQKGTNGVYVNCTDIGDVSGSRTNNLSFGSVTISDAADYRLIVTNAYGAATSQVATVTVTLSPTIVTQPASVSIGLGNAVQLISTVSGILPIVYQWQKETNGVFLNVNDSDDISGSATNSLDFNSTTLPDTGNYRLVVTNTYGAATSQVATITVLLSPPSIIAQPPSVTLANGSLYRLTASATGALPLTYQWQKETNGIYVDIVDAGDISGSATNGLEFNPVVMSDAVGYRLIVTSAYGSVTSQVANVSVFVPSADNSVRTGFSYGYVTNYSDWVDAFLAGNGQMGIMVFGNPLNDTIIYNDRKFNLAANTSSPVRTFAQVSVSDEAIIRSNCAAGNYSAADNLAVNSAQYHDGGEGSRHPGYEMLISIPQDGTVNDYSRVCNFRTGEISVNWSDNRGNWSRKAFVSRKDNVTVQYLPAPSNETITCSIQLTTDSGMNFPSGMSFTSLASANFLNMRVKYPSSAGDVGYEGVTRVVVSGGTENVSGSVLNISNATSVLLLTRTAKYYDNCENQWNQGLLQNQLASLPTDYDILLNGQLATHEIIYDRVKLDFNANVQDRALPNETLLNMQASSSTPVKALWERAFDAGRYYFLSSSSSNTPPDLLGMWTGDCNAGWGGFYTLDANLNLQIAGGNIGNMPEAMAGYFAINEGWQKDFETNASKLLDCRGMLAAGNTPGTNGLISSISTYYPYQYATGEEGWMLYPFWEHYLITGDTNFLQNELYPLLKDMGYFYEDFLTQTDANGNYILAGSVSPENQPAGLGVSLVNNSTFDISGARFALTALVQTCDILKLDQGPGQGVETWSNILNKLPPYLIGGVTGDGNSVGALQEWDWSGLKDNFNHRHSSQMLTVWPFREITPETTPALFNAAALTLGQKDQYNYENAGHGWLHSALVAAGLKNAMAVNKKILYLTSQGFYYNSLSSSHYNNHGTFCTDTCNAMPGIMIEMLVSSSPGVLELLPALPQGLDQGSISGVKGRNQVTVQNLSWDMNNQSVNCTLRSDIDQDITFIERSGINTINTSASVSPSSLGQIARVIHLQAGVSTDIAIGLGQFNLALNRPVTASSGNSSASNAVDGNDGTAWTSSGTQNEWVYVDLGSVYHLTGAQINWGTSYGQTYNIQVSGDAVNWTNVFETPDGFGGVDRITFSASGRYVRLLGVQSSATGYSVSEFQVFGNVASLLPSTPTNLTATAISSSQVNLSWAASANATGYNVKRSITTGGPYTIIATNISSLTYNDTGLSVGTLYYYVVSAINSYGESDNSDEVAARPVSATIPPLKIGVSNSMIQISWPTDHLGWFLEAQTNAVGAGLGTNWFTIPNSSLVNQMLIPANLTEGSVFYRLVYPQNNN